MRPYLPVLTMLLGSSFASSDLGAEDVPYVVQWRSRKEGRRGYSVCTGSLVTPCWVLTARHCAVGLLSNRAVTVTVSFFDPAKTPIRFNAQTVRVEEAHAPESSGLDIALVKLKENVTDVPLAILDAVEYGSSKSTPVFPVGASGGLHWTGPKEASGSTKKDKILVDNTAGSGGMRGGDSGGPWLRPVDSTTYVVTGVISGGFRRGGKRYGKAYQPSFVRGWIDETTSGDAMWSDIHLNITSEFLEVGAVATLHSSAASLLVALLLLALVGMGVAMLRCGRTRVVTEEESPMLE